MEKRPYRALPFSRRMFMLIEIDAERCVGCGKCVADCVGSNLAVEDGFAQVKGRCILCGHCVACLLYTSRCV